MAVWNKYKTLSLLMSICFSLPIWFYLMFVLLKNAQVDRLVWFLYYIYIPVSILVTIFVKIGEE